VRAEQGHHWKDTLFKYEIEQRYWADKTGLSVDIDDCDCDDCVAARGALDMYSTLHIKIHTDDNVVAQRITAEEALELSKLLKAYAHVVNKMTEVSANSLEGLA